MNGILIPSTADIMENINKSAPQDAGQALIDGAAETAALTLIELLNPIHSARTRLEAAKTLLDRAGLSAKPRLADPPAPRDLNDLDPDELQRLLDKAESARAAVAKPVSASEVARNSDQVVDPFS